MHGNSNRYRLTVLVIILFLIAGGRQSVSQTSAKSTAREGQAEQNNQWPPDAAGLRLHMIGNAHIDSPWLWPLAETNSVVHSTFRSALDRLKENPQVTMTASSSQFYEWVAESDPAMLAEIRERVKEGRWDLVGGWWVEPDVNMPSGEALIRQGLYGQRTLKKLFGRMATVGYNPDSFGHNGNVPQILKLEGMRDYVFMRPGPTEKQLPSNLFWWQGIDGTKALTFRIPYSYNDFGDVRDHMLKEIQLLHGQSVRDDMEFYGVGDHGGGPTKVGIRSIERIQGEKGAPKLLFSTPDRYFAEVRQRGLTENLPVVIGDLQHHSVGCYTAGSEIKKLNRVTESDLITAEKIASIGSVVWGANYPKQELTTAWKKVLLLQFHDALAGTTLPSYFEAERDGYGRARDIARETMYLAAQKLAWQIPTTDPDSKYLVVFNPHSWAAKLPIEYDLGWKPKNSSILEDESGHPIPFQWVKASTTVSDRVRLAAVVQVPPMGYRQIRLRPDPGFKPLQPDPALRVSNNEMENSHLKVQFLADGNIGIFDKDNQWQVLQKAGGMRALVINDPSDTWSHDVRAYTDVVGSFALKEIKVVEDGPLRVRVREKYSYNNSHLTLDYLLYANSRNLEIRVALDWHEHQKMLKFALPVNVSSPQATYEIPYGAIGRGTNGDEDPGQRWIDVSGNSSGHEYGLALINNAKYGYSVDGSEMRLSVARSAVFAHHQPAKLLPGIDYQWMDQGLQKFRIELVPHANNWQKVDLARKAEELVAETPIIYQGIHPGKLPESGSFLDVDASDIIVSAAKQAEDGDDIIVRAYETQGLASRARIDLRFAHTEWSGNFHPFEIKTLRVNPHTGKVSEVNALEE